MKLTAQESQKVAEAFLSLRAAGQGLVVVKAHLTALLEDYKGQLVYNQNPVAIPVLQGRAQQLEDILTMMEGKI